MSLEDVVRAVTHSTRIRCPVCADNRKGNNKTQQMQKSKKNITREYFYMYMYLHLCISRHHHADIATSAEGTPQDDSAPHTAFAVSA